jgi:diguanylate cyclase (GGDEF)-like protein
MRAVFVCLSVLFTVLAWGPAHAQAGAVGRPIAVCVAPDRPGMTAARALTDPQGFDCARPQGEFGRGDFWVRSGPLPADLPTDQPLAVRTGSVWQDGVTLYALYADGKVAVSRTNDRGLARSIQLGAIIERTLPERDVRPVQLVWHVKGAANVRGIVIGARIATTAESARSNLMLGALYAAFAGFALALLAHNLALWRALRQRFQLYYIGMLGALMVYALSSSGALAWGGVDIPNTLRLRVNYLTLAIAAACAVGFARNFFEPRIFAGWLGRIADIAAVTMLAAGIGFAVLTPWGIGPLDRIYACTFVGLSAVIFPMLWRAWRMRSDYRWLFGIAWSAPIILGAVRIVYSLGGLHWNFWIDNSTLISMAAEALISSLAIAYRVRQVARDRDTARAEELAARLLADTDSLTGLLNRRAFLSRAIGREGPQRLLLLDIDHFKRVNDTIGHDGGDEVLRRVARLLRACCPVDGLAVRLGGEEFAILAPVATAPDTAALLAGLREMRMPFDLHVTASIGACDGPLAHDGDWKSLYRAADRALFEAKAAGRDRARRAGDRPALAA